MWLPFAEAISMSDIYVQSEEVIRSGLLFTDWPDWNPQNQIIQWSSRASAFSGEIPSPGLHKQNPAHPPAAAYHPWASEDSNPSKTLTICQNSGCLLCFDAQHHSIKALMGGVHFSGKGGLKFLLITAQVAWGGLHLSKGILPKVISGNKSLKLCINLPSICLTSDHLRSHSSVRPKLTIIIPPVPPCTHRANPKICHFRPEETSVNKDVLGF